MYKTIMPFHSTHPLVAMKWCKVVCVCSYVEQSHGFEFQTIVFHVAPTLQLLMQDKGAYRM